jgi:hypothetical protein
MCCLAAFKVLASIQMCLQAKAAKGELYHIPEIGGFFDDANHYAQIKCVMLQAAEQHQQMWGHGMHPCGSPLLHRMTSQLCAISV